MKAITYTDFKKNLRPIIDLVVKNQITFCIKRKSGEKFVMMSKKEFDGFQETFYLLGSQANASRLRQSIQQYNQMKNNKKGTIRSQ